MKTLAKVIVGSTSQGLRLPTSDIDYMGLYKYPIDEYLYNPKLVITKDNNNTSTYEIGHAVELLCKGNPTLLSLLYTDDEFIVETSDEFEQLRAIRYMFLTNECKNAFIGFIKSQVHKSRNEDAKMNWSIDKKVRKTILDFCYVNINKESSISLTTWLNQMNLTQQDISVAKINRSEDAYNIYLQKGGLYDELVDSNQLKTPNIDLELKPIAVMFYKHQAYSEYCKHYKEYVEWEQNYNKSRFIKGTNGELYNSKNLMHAVRLINMAQELANHNQLIVNREKALSGSFTVKELLDIRLGKVNPEEIINWIDSQIPDLIKAFNSNSMLNQNIDNSIIKDLIIKLRK